uniref:C2H2-type domain-containing protein n=1 Tax=Stomoxys calcitrans TaxID=35570 RepID=A0A1I8Q9M8_STOCA
MSSDESTSTHISDISSQAEKEKLKPHKAEQWEINVIGNFLLTLYHRMKITPKNDWLCHKTDIRKEFEQFATPDLMQRFKKANGTDNIGTLLHRCGFLCNTPRGSHFYKLKSKIIFEFRHKKMMEQDRNRLNDDTNSPTTAGVEDILSDLVAHQQLCPLQVNYEIDEDSPVYPLQYEGTTMQERRHNFYPTNMSCYICQEDFTTMNGYEEHIQIHNDGKDFEYLKELSQFDSPIFTMTYRLCKNSHHFCFTIETDRFDLMIEKIIIVQSRSMFYVHNMRVPYAMPASRRENFFVDSHLFTIFVEQPIILICHLASSKETIIIEEHHFMRSEEFPKVNLVLKPTQLPSKKTFRAILPLYDYFPPLEIRDALNDNFIYEKLMKTSPEFNDYIRNEKQLKSHTIGQTLTTLLHIEDMDAMKEYLNLLQHNVKLRCFGNVYSVKLHPKQRVHIENILTVFDEVILTTRKDIKAGSEQLVKLILQNKDDMKESDTYLGYIEDVNSGRVAFKCYHTLDLKRSYTVVFRPSRLQLRLQYRAMEMLPSVMPFLKKFLFPSQLLPMEPSYKNLSLYNASIAHNPEQLQAVRNIAEGPRNDATYIIFGPPGTGKTTTLVEAILQVWKRDGTKILVTASSNSACDEIALRLCKILSKLDESRSIVRIFAQSNEARMETIDDLLLEYSNLYSAHFYPDVEVLHEYRIVVCTMSVVAKLSLGKFGRSENGGAKYTHLFIDEVAASTEVEALMTITSILTPKSCLIIAGDNKQLGPIVKSKRAEEFKLGQSLMDRLLERECYRVNTDTDSYDRTIQTRLRLNFRSHPAIVNLYSGLYYNHALEAEANLADVSLVKNWHKAPSNDFPIIFDSVNGKTCTDNQSSSSYNFDEINIVMEYVKDLMYFGINGQEVQQSDIGVISPYKKQYIRIREELNLRRWYQIETGSVENFQGKEKNIIIVSFVRSNTPTLGFLENPRRLNVTLSRAKSLLILIGNAKTLSINEEFDYIIKECQRHKTFIVRPEPRSFFAGKGEEKRQKNRKNETTSRNKINKEPKGNEKREEVQKGPQHQQKYSKYEIDKENIPEDKNEEKNDVDDDDDDDDDSDDDGQEAIETPKGKSNRSQNMKKKKSSNNIGQKKKVGVQEKQSPVMENQTTLEFVNSSLKDLKLKNNDSMKNLKKKKNHKRRQRGGKKTACVAGDENENDEEEDEIDVENSDNEEEEDVDDEDEDEKPTTSKSSRKLNRAQQFKAKNEIMAKGKPLAKEIEVSKGKLDDLFSELPNVPDSVKTSNVHNDQNPIPTTYNNRPTPLTNMPKPQPHYFVQPQNNFIHPQQRMPQNNQANYMGFSQPVMQYNSLGNDQQMLNAQGMQQHTIYGTGFMNHQQRPLNPHYMQHQQMACPTPQFNHQQPIPPYYQHGNTFFAGNNNNQNCPRPTSHVYGNLRMPLVNGEYFQADVKKEKGVNNKKQTKNDNEKPPRLQATKNNTGVDKKNDAKTKRIKNIKQHQYFERPARFQAKKGNKDKKAHNDDEDDDEEDIDTKPSTSKLGEKAHLAHSMKKKKQHQNDTKVAKVLKSVGMTQNNTKASVEIKDTVQPLSPKPSSKIKKPTISVETQSTIDDEVAKKNKKTQESTPLASNINSNATHQKTLDAKLSELRAGADKRPGLSFEQFQHMMAKRGNKNGDSVIASKPPAVISKNSFNQNMESGARTQMTEISATTSTIQPLSNQVKFDPSSSNVSSVQIKSLYASKPYNSLDKTPSEQDGGTRLATSSLSRPTAFVNATVAGQNAGGNISRTTTNISSTPLINNLPIDTAERVYPTSNVGLGVSNPTPVSGYSSTSLNRNAAITNINPGLNSPISVATNTVHTHQGTSYSQPHRPIRNLQPQTKKDDKCVIA